MSFPTYSGLRESGVEWLGQVPHEWAVAPVKHLAGFLNGEAFKPGEWSSEGIPIIRIQNLNGGDSFNFFKGEVDKRYHVEFGDLLFGWSGNRGTSFGPFIWRREGLHYLNQHIFKVIPKGVNPDWLYWCLQGVTEYIEQQAHGIIGMVHVTSGKLGAIPVPQIDYATQTAIAKFLDRETDKIDVLVAEQERLIALLKEKRQAVISHAVTKGLNPNAPMKDSGIEWLGEIPAHWDVRRLRQLATLNPSKSEIGDWDAETEVSFLPMEAIGEHGALSLERTRPIAESQTGYTYFREGDVTIAKITPCFENGKGAIMKGLVQGVGFGTTELIVIRPSQDATTSEFLDWNFRSETFRALGEGSMYGAGGQKRVPDDFVRDFPICLPSLEEQRQIVGYLDRMTLRFDSLSAEAQSAIALLQERRATLISAAVTGKIDVRGLVATEQELELA